MSTYKIALLPGDGIGPEIMDATLVVLKGIAKQLNDLDFAFEKFPLGANHYKKTGELLPNVALDGFKKSDAILLSAIGLPEVRFPDGTEIQPHIIIGLRKELDLYAAVRPVKLYPGVHSPLANITKGIDFAIVRENTEGLFASFNGGSVVKDEVVADSMIITRKGSQRVIDYAFKLAEKRNGRPSDGKKVVTCVDKANIFKSLAFFRKIFDEVKQKYSHIETNAAYVDAMTVYMLQKPWDYDVMVMENMFGDILSDLGAGMVGGLGLGPSSEIGDNYMLFQPSHGSAPDIAGKNIANPIATILSASMMLESLGQKNQDKQAIYIAKVLEDAIKEVLLISDKLTPDLGGKGTTMELGDSILNAALNILHKG